jgi:hypothetical protein
MSDRGETFFDLYARGHARAEEMDDFIARWHEADPGSPIAAMSLHSFLGLTWHEYAEWVGDPDALPRILEARRRAAAAHPAPGGAGRDRPGAARAAAAGAGPATPRRRRGGH